MHALHVYELSALHSLQSLFRSDWMDLFFLAWNFVDTKEFAFLLLPFVWLFFGQRWGARVFTLILLNALINTLCKAFFNLPRPLHLDPSLGLIPLTSPGFPSGAAQKAALFTCLVLAQKPPKLLAVEILLFSLLLSFSRLYLGVHFFSDIIGGWAIGALFFLAYQRFHEPIERQFASRPLFASLLYTQLFPLALIGFFFGWQKIAFIGLFFMGAGCGVFLLQWQQIRFFPAPRIGQRLFAFACGATGLFLFSMLSPIAVYFFSWMMGLWIAWGAPVLSLSLFGSREITESLI